MTKKAESPEGRPMTEADIARLRERRIRLAKADRDSRSIVERMRDEDEKRLVRSKGNSR